MKTKIAQLFSFLFLLSFSFTTPTAAQTEETVDEVVDCKTLSRSIQGPSDILIDVPHEFTVLGTKVKSLGSGTDTQEDSPDFKITQGTVQELLGDGADIKFQVFMGNQNKHSSQEARLIFAFPEATNYTVDAVITNPDCTYKITKEITAHNAIYSVIGEESSLLPENLINNIQQHGHYIHRINIPANTSTEEIENTIAENKLTLQDSTALFLSKERIYSVLPILERSKEELLGTGSLSLVVVTNQNKQITQKILTPLLRTITFPQTYLVSNQEFTDLMIGLSIGQPFNTQKLAQQKRKFDKSQMKFSLNYIVDYLIYQGFPLELISILLSLTLAIACIVFWKQIIGRSAFGVFYPLLFAFNMHLLGFKTAIGFIVIGACTVLLTNLIIKKINLLYSAKIGLNITLYVLLTLIALRVVHSTIGQPETYEVYLQPMFLLAYITQLMVSFRLFKKRKIFSLKSRQTLLLFGILSIIIYVVFHSQNIQEWMLTHPLFIFIVMVVILIMGRYTGLQATEVVRFWPLIKKQFKR